MHACVAMHTHARMCAAMQQAHDDDAGGESGGEIRIVNRGGPVPIYLHSAYTENLYGFKETI